MSLPLWILQVSALLAAAVLVGIFAQRARLPLTVVLAVFGFAAGGLGASIGFSSPVRGEQFEAVVVFLFLPVLVFEAALGLSTRSFFRNLGPILVLAVPALLISAAVVGAALYRVLGVPLAAALLFGALISATDPVAVVAVFRKLGVPQRLLTLVEGESLLNDGVAIVMFEILLAAALGGEISVLAGLWDFVKVFAGGVLIGALIGLAVAVALPWLDQLAAAALSIAAAYGGFVLADDVLGFSGVMATVAAGLVLGGLEPSRASAETRDMWHKLWETLGYVANALLFLLIGLAIEPALLFDNIGAILLAIVAVLVARTVAVVPLVSALQRFTGIPRVGRRNEAVLIWGGLRGGVALALALALPEDLPQRELFIAMTGGVVLTTLLLNATTIGALVHRLRLDQPSRANQFLANGARIVGLHAARHQLDDLGLENPEVVSRLEQAEHDAREHLEQIDLSSTEELEVVTRRGLFVERETYQRLSDAGLLPPATTLLLLHEVDDKIGDVSLGRATLKDITERKRPRFDQWLEQLNGWLPSSVSAEPSELAYAEATARQLAARRTIDAIELFEQLPNITPATVQKAKQTFTRWEQEARESLAKLDQHATDEQRAIYARQAAALSRIAAADALGALASIGLLPEATAEHEAEELAEEIGKRHA